MFSLLNFGFIFKPFYFAPLCFQTTANTFFHALLDCCVLILPTDWLLTVWSCFILQCSWGLISPLVLFVMLSTLEKKQTFQYKQETSWCVSAAAVLFINVPQETQVGKTVPRWRSHWIFQGGGCLFVQSYNSLPKNQGSYLALKYDLFFDVIKALKGQQWE